MSRRKPKCAQKPIKSGPLQRIRRQVLEWRELIQLTFDFRLSPNRAENIPTAERKPESSESPSSGVPRLTRPDLTQLWQAIAMEYFPSAFELLQSYTVVWSGRPQTRTLASCNVERRRILVAPAMQEQECQQHLPALLYHEMCHAVLGIPEAVGGRRRIHTREFRLLESLHPEIKLLDLWVKQGGWETVAKSHRRRWRKRRAELARDPRARQNF